jgi:hypothetical protein
MLQETLENKTMKKLSLAFTKMKLNKSMKKQSGPCSPSPLPSTKVCHRHLLHWSRGQHSLSQEGAEHLHETFKGPPPPRGWTSVDRHHKRQGEPPAGWQPNMVVLINFFLSKSTTWLLVCNILFLTETWENLENLRNLHLCLLFYLSFRKAHIIFKNQVFVMCCWK